ncbi:MAG TPA: GC-type dockerin domain-anchored protein [Thermoanaerobaculia bacterium]|nr:GC-type dockerin domain-anchored protein [Thermoanaerobaculia bacterium]
MRRRILSRALGLILLFGLFLAGQPAMAEPCPADYNGDGQVNEDDVYAFLNVWYATVEADINQDGQVTMDDVYAFLDLYFAGLPGADVNDDGIVSLDDLYYFLDAWELVTNSPSTDFDGDGQVTQSGTTDPGDLFAFLASWHAGC